MFALIRTIAGTPRADARDSPTKDQCVCTFVAALVFCTFLASCSQPKAGPRTEDLQPLLGKTVQEVASALDVPESSLRPGDEPPGEFRIVSGYLPDEPFGRRLVIYVSRADAVFSPERKISPEVLFDKKAVGIAVSFPVAERRPDVVVGDVIGYYHAEP
jgi:hypothetical protein